MNATIYCSIAVKTPFNNSVLLYSMDQFQKELVPGMMVSIPFRNKFSRGIVMECNLTAGILKDLDPEKVKAISEIIDANFILPGRELRFFCWIGRYYHYPVGQLLSDCIPRKISRIKDPSIILGKGEKLPFTLTDIQGKCCRKLDARDPSRFSKWLIHGVTGSGKTSIYLHAIRKTLERGRSVLFLLPEINLSPQFIGTISTFIDGTILSYNSTMTPSRKYCFWSYLLKDHRPKVIVAVRSGIFLPISRLGLIVVDEEHDQSFKQQERCPYNARDLAYKKALDQSATLILGSATPSLETFYKFQKSERDHYLPIQERVGSATLPRIHLIDARPPKRKPENEKFMETWPIQREVLDKIRDKLDGKEQVIIFINRLGYANFIQCRHCGKTFKCEHCSVSLKYFKSRGELCCQICHFKRSLPEFCPDCGNLKLLLKGFGTEKIMTVLSAYFPKANIERFDRDKIKRTSDLEKTLKRFHSGEIDIFIGTQMLAKGHNFKKVNLVVILGIDSQLNLPDFRSSEKVYQTLEQVSGRSGRYSERSDVYILSLSPKNKVFSFIKDHSFKEPYLYELQFRKEFQYPPFSYLAALYCTGKKLSKVKRDVEEMVIFLKSIKDSTHSSIQILGPRAALIEKRIDQFTWTIVLKAILRRDLHHALLRIVESKGSTVKIDVDPYYIL